MGSFAEEREIESLKRKWKIAEIVDFEEIEKADTFSPHSIITTKEEKLPSFKRVSLKNTSTTNSSISGKLTLTTLFKMKKETQKERVVKNEKRTSQEISKLTLSNLFRKS